ncbi:hypothetical protein PTKIN_Ptkin09bG0164300 [Pterospermum kingtungense]
MERRLEDLVLLEDEEDELLLELDGEPWPYDNHLLLLHKLAPGEVSVMVLLVTTNFWIGVYDLPVGYMSLNIGKQLGNYIVQVDVRMPLKRKKKISCPGSQGLMVNFKYEKLPSFCFVCGLLGHVEQFCSKVFDQPNGDVRRDWGAWLRVLNRKSENLGGEKWLREEEEESFVPGGSGLLIGDGGATHRGWQLRENIGDMFSNIEHRCLSMNVSGGSGQQTATVQSINSGHIFHAKSMEVGMENASLQSPLADEHNKYVLDLTEERKRRRGLDSNLAQSKEIELDSLSNKGKDELKVVDAGTQEFYSILAGLGL